jgi:hypothetical protein
MNWLEIEGRLYGRGRQNDADALRSPHHVSVGQDVAIGVNDNARTDGVLPDNSRRVCVSILLVRSVTCDYDLDHCCRTFCHNFLKRRIQLTQ